MISIGICTSMDRLPPAQENLDFLEVSVGPALCPREGEAEFARRRDLLNGSPVPVRSLNVLFSHDLGIRLTGPEPTAQAADDYLRIVIRRAAAIGVETLVFGSGSARRPPEGFDSQAAREQLAAHLRRWAPWLDGAGLSIALEPLRARDCAVVNTLQHGADIVRAVNHPAVRLLADTFHMSESGDAPEEIARFAELLGHVHVAQAGSRRAPFAGESSLIPWLTVLKRVGYSGRCSIECSSHDWIPDGVPAVVAELRRQINAA